METPTPPAESAVATAAETAPADPFEGFQTQEYAAGEQVAEKTAEKPAEETPAGEDAVEAPAGEGEEGAKPGEPKKQTAQERINEVTRARREAERRAEQAEAALAETRAQLEQAAGRKPAPLPEKPAGETPPADATPSPDDFEFGELDPRYIAAVVKHETAKAVAEIRANDERTAQERQAEERQRAARAKFEEKVTVGSTKHADFVEKVLIGAEKGEWPLSAELGSLIVDSDVGDEIAYHLATNPDEAIRVFHQSPVEQARFFGRMEAQFSAAQSAAPGSKPEQAAPAKAPQAPAPVLPARGVGGQFQGTASSDDFSAFEAAAQGK